LTTRCERSGVTVRVLRSKPVRSAKLRWANKGRLYCAAMDTMLRYLAGVVLATKRTRPERSAGNDNPSLVLHPYRAFGEAEAALDEFDLGSGRSIEGSIRRMCLAARRRSTRKFQTRCSSTGPTSRRPAILTEAGYPRGHSSMLLHRAYMQFTDAGPIATS
jgi:hypothetical protein